MSVLALGAILGCATYYMWPYEPSVLIAPVLSMIAVLGLTLLKRLSHPYAAAFVLSFALFMGWSQWQTQHAHYISLPEHLSEQRLWLIGQIAEKQSNDRRDRVLLQHTKIYAATEQALPTRIRLSTQKNRFAEHQIGDWVAVQAKLFTPRPPSFDGDFDARWHAFHHAYEASGMVMGGIYATHLENTPKQTPWLMALRHRVAAMLNPHQTPEGALSAALMTGLKDAIPENAKQHFRDAGLAHLLAISGMHLAMVGGLIFLVSRTVMAHTALATHYNIKHIAAVIGLFSAFGYMLLAGATIPTMRAFLMLGLLFLAILLGRLRLGVRVICFAVCVVLLIWPHGVLSASFQMSFIAAFALIYWSYQREQKETSHVALVRRFDYFHHIWAASVVAGLATMPLAAAHFQHVSLVGFFLNLVAIPLLGTLLLPLALLSLIVGGFAAVLAALHFVAGLMLDWAAFGAQFTGAGVYAPHWPVLLGIAVVAIGAYCLRYWRVFWFSFMALIAVVFLWPNTAPFDVAWQKHGEVMAIHKKDSLITVASLDGYEDTFYLSELAKYFDLTTQKEADMCDTVACLVEIKQQRILIMRTQPPSLEDCHMVDWVISSFKVINACEDKVIKLPEKGFLRFTPYQYELRAYESKNTRPWHAVKNSV